MRPVLGGGAWRRLPALVLFAVLALPSAARSQSQPASRATEPRGATSPQPRRVGLGLAGGVSHLSSGASRNTGLLAIRGDLLVRRRVVLELGSSFFSSTAQVAGQSTYAVPEVQLQLQRADGRIRPYIGVGIGMATRISSADRGGAQETAESDTRVTPSASIGMRAGPRRGRIELRTDVRVRGDGPWPGASRAGEATIGFGMRL